MLPNQLTAGSFAAYPPEARQLAVKQLALLQRLPLAFVPLLLREMIVYDWKFPAERADLNRQFAYLGAMAAGPFQAAMSAFAQLQSVAKSDYRLFRKLRPHGVYYTRVRHDGGAQLLLNAAAARAKAHSVAYGHWYIDGGAGLAAPESITQVSYDALSAPRAALQTRMQKTYEAAVFDPEAFRTMLAQIKPEEAGLNAGGDYVLNRFQLSLLTEGSGTQVFSTTFVQWAAREALRRAQPLTIVTRFAPRQRENQMNELLAERQRKPELDPQGSLIDADMGAYYTWLNQQRLPGEDKSAFLAWFEDHDEAVAIAPTLERGARSDEPIDLAELIARIA